MGRKSKTFTPEEEKLMIGMASVGMTHEQIAQACGVCTKTLQRKLGDKLYSAKIKGVASIATSLFQNAKSGNVAAQIFIMKTQAQWRESDSIGESQTGPLRIELIRGQDRPSVKSKVTELKRNGTSDG